MVGCGSADMRLDACLHWAACVAIPPLNPGPFNTQVYHGAVTDCHAWLARASSLPLDVQGFQLTAAQVDCVAHAGTDCGRVLGCLSAAAEPQPCSAPPLECDGDVAISCLDAGRGPQRLQLDCSRFGQHCSSGFCGSACDASFPPQCAGGRYQYCDTNRGMVTVLEDCSANGATCSQPDGSSAPTCIGTGAACANAVERCDGDVRVLCIGNREARVDCAATGEHCLADVRGSATGCARGGGCSSAATCDGARLSFCDDGLLSVVDCRAHGYRDCDASVGGRCAL
jgi:hypothetical protein